MIDELEWKREFEDAVADLNPQLLAVGGICVSSQPYDLVDMIADAGENMTLPVETMYMDWGQCHANVSKLWAEGVVDKICTGYALGDEEWVPHSWGIKEETIIETTRSMRAYFGVALSSFEADIFAERVL
jgi:hypothetical protein